MFSHKSKCGTKQHGVEVHMNLTVGVSQLHCSYAAIIIPFATDMTVHSSPSP